MWKLVIEDDEGKRTTVPLTRDDYTIGRKEGNTIRLTERNVSREHAKLQKKNGVPEPRSRRDRASEAATEGDGLARYVLEDLTSYNGVYVNGLRVAQTQELTHGDLVQIGDYRIILQDDTAADVLGPSIPLDTEDLNATMPQVQGLPLRGQMMLEQPNRLVMLAGPTPGAEYALVGERMTIGRAEEATVSVNHNSVSRLHCEVHALGEGRFEIVDKGSSNGVRVNGADLRRGIIEAGDLIELGDVKFKFVGEGEIFRAGATESQQLAAIGNRDASAQAPEHRQRGGIVPYVLLGAFVGIAVAGWFYVRPRPEPVAFPSQPPPSAGAPERSDQTALLADAKRTCDTGDCEAAHQRISQLPDSSSARQSQEFKDIEFKWATLFLLRADAEADVATRRALLDKVVGASTVDATLRKTAADRMALLDSAPTASTAGKDAGRLPVTSLAANTPAPLRPRTPGTDALPPQQAAVPPPAHAPSASGPKPPVVPSAHPSVFDLGKSDNPDDWQKARTLLEPRVYAGRATPDEVRMLKAICKRQGDRTCVETCNAFATAATTP